jgi:hypothetical protein
MNSKIILKEVTQFADDTEYIIMRRIDDEVLFDFAYCHYDCDEFWFCNVFDGGLFGKEEIVAVYEHPTDTKIEVSEFERVA